MPGRVEQIGVGKRRGAVNLGERGRGCRLPDHPELASDARRRAELVLADLLRPVPLTTIDLRLPADERARQVAAGLIGAPADQRGLAEWGQHVGASERTLAGRLWQAPG